MYIDFHTHAFADKIAERAIARLLSVFPGELFTDGTVGSLKRTLREDGIDKAVFLPIATKPTQQTVINNLSQELNSDSFICFGSIHPEAEDWEEELLRIKSMGLLGVKFHPDYQDFYIEEERLFPIYEKISELGLIAVFHAGYDPLSPDDHHCKPKEAADVAKRFPDMKMVLAHLGGMRRFDEVERYVVGLPNVWLDTAFLAGNIESEQFLRIVRLHGADKVLLASDLPWQKTSAVIELIEATPFTAEEKEWIYHKSAERLLGIE